MSKLSNLKIFPINIGQEDISKAEFFFKELNIKNLKIYFDAPITLAKKFSLRGVPTTILFNKAGARNLLELLGLLILRMRNLLIG